MFTAFTCKYPQPFLACFSFLELRENIWVNSFESNSHVLYSLDDVTANLKSLHNAAVTCPLLYALLLIFNGK